MSLITCFECGWSDTDSGYFTEDQGEQYCSIHKDSILCGACGLYDRGTHNCEEEFIEDMQADGQLLSYCGDCLRPLIDGCNCAT